MRSGFYVTVVRIGLCLASYSIDRVYVKLVIVVTVVSIIRPHRMHEVRRCGLCVSVSVGHNR